MSETPRTDNEVHNQDGLNEEASVSVKFARQLERELAEAMEEIKRLKEIVKVADEATTEDEEGLLPAWGAVRIQEAIKSYLATFRCSHV